MEMIVFGPLPLPLCLDQSDWMVFNGGSGNKGDGDPIRSCVIKIFVVVAVEINCSSRLYDIDRIQSLTATSPLGNKVCLSV